MEQYRIQSDVRGLLRVLQRYLFMIVTITLTAVLTSAVLSFFFIPPAYKATAELLIHKARQESGMYLLPASELEANVELIKTYNEIIISPSLLELVAGKLGEPDKGKALAKKISVSGIRHSQVMAITVEDRNPAKAAQIANMLAATFQSEVVKRMNIENIQVLAEAKAERASSTKLVTLALHISTAFFLGLAVSVGLAFLLELTDRRIRTEEEIESHLDLPVLGTVAAIPVHSSKLKSKAEEERFIVPLVYEDGSQLPTKE